jgi:hypothetical protein
VALCRRAVFGRASVRQPGRELRPWLIWEVLRSTHELQRHFQ